MKPDPEIKYLATVAALSITTTSLAGALVAVVFALLWGG